MAVAGVSHDFAAARASVGGAGRGTEGAEKPQTGARWAQALATARVPPWRHPHYKFGAVAVGGGVACDGVGAGCAKG